MAPIFIKSPRLTLRTPSLEDAPVFRDVMNDRDTTLYLFSNPSEWTTERAEKCLQRFIDADEGNRACFLSIEMYGKFAGTGGINGYEEGTGDIGVHLAKEFFGQGIAVETLYLTCLYGFETLKLNILEAGTLDENTRMTGVFEGAFGLKPTMAVAEQPGFVGKPERQYSMKLEDWPTIKANVLAWNEKHKKFPL